MPQPHIRPLVICLFQHADKILVVEGHDPLKPETFYRPLGGGIEFGEYAQQALVRELREELNAEIKDAHYLFTLENIFTFNGQAGHEIVLVYDGTFADETLYQREVIDGQEDDGTPFSAVWKSLAELTDDNPPLYPVGLLKRLQKINPIAQQ
jgi:8-oxo-dGTP pyrophosphatase MutT (NUDIX family)